jgi:hypothetical protein
MLQTAAEIDAHRHRKGVAHVAVVASSPKMAALAKLTAEYERRISALLSEDDAGRQTPASRPTLTAARQGRRSPRGPDVETS